MKGIIVGLRVSPIFRKLLEDYRDYKSEEKGYYLSLSAVAQEMIFQEMKNDEGFNEYIKNKGVANETNK